MTASYPVRANHTGSLPWKYNLLEPLVPEAPTQVFGFCGHPRFNPIESAVLKSNIYCSKLPVMDQVQDKLRALAFQLRLPVIG